MKTNQTINKKFSLLPLLWKGLAGGLLLLALTGCPGDIQDIVDPIDPEEKVEYVMQDVALNGIVKDESGNPLSGVKVTTGTASATTGSDGTFTFAQAGTVDDRAVIKFEKSGYFTLTRSGDKADEMYDEVMLYPKGNSDISLQTTFDASKAKTLQVGGVKIELPANCFAKTDGSAYSGTVHADVLYLAPDNENASSMMPGGDLATDKKDKMMLPVGTADVVFTDDAGNPLKIKAKTNVPVSYALPSNMSADGLPATIPLWLFDEARGVWRQEGSATLKGNVYSGTATHFSPKAPGLELEEVGLVVVKAVECEDKPASHVAITVEANWGPGLHPLVFDLWPDGWSFEKSYTGSDGLCDIFTPPDVPVKVTGSYKGKTKIAENMGMNNFFLEFKDDCKQTVIVHATACDKPASGADVAVDINDDAYPDLIKKQTNSAGECSFEIPVDCRVTILISYKDQDEEKDVIIYSSDNYGPRTVDFAFDEGCDTELPEKCAYKWYIEHEPGETETDRWHKFSCISFDNFGKRIRSDDYYDTGGSSAYYFGVFNYLTGIWYNFYAGDLPHLDWDEWGPIDPDRDYTDDFYITNSDSWFKSNGYIHRPDTVILGKTCSVWAEPVVNWLGIPTEQIVFYNWKRIPMLRTRKGEIEWEIAAITEDVPDEAFSFVMQPYWIATEPVVLGNLSE